MTRSRSGPDSDRLTVARLDGIATRRARWGAATEDQITAGAAELRELAADRPDLLAEVAGIALGTAERKGPEYRARARPSPGCAARRRRRGRDPGIDRRGKTQGRGRTAAPAQPSGPYTAEALSASAIRRARNPLASCHLYPACPSCGQARRLPGPGPDSGLAISASGTP